jgi:phosphatidylglycerol---prolipoprotein diacylglyceryl transferase
MLTHPSFDPVALQLGPLAIHWYGLTYLLAFGLFMLLANMRLKHEPFASIQGPGAWSRKDIEDMLFAGVLGVVIGGRLGYCLFYKPGFYLANPLQILYVWQGGMSFHGGLIGVIVSQIWFARSRGKPFWQLMDFVAPCVPPGLGCGRLGNFINGELWGRSTDVRWGFVVNGVTRHATQLYEAALEGILLFSVLWWFTAKPRPRWAPAGLFLIIYSLARITVEFWRMPDIHLNEAAQGYLAGHWLTMGMVLSLPMLLTGIALMLIAYRRREPSGNFAAVPA